MELNICRLLTSISCLVSIGSLINVIHYYKKTKGYIDWLEKIVDGFGKDYRRLETEYSKLKEEYSKLMQSRK